jgi:hypothetical protein
LPPQILWILSARATASGTVVHTPLPEDWRLALTQLPHRWLLLLLLQLHKALTR